MLETANVLTACCRKNWQTDPLWFVVTWSGSLQKSHLTKATVQGSEKWLGTLAKFGLERHFFDITLLTNSLKVSER